MIDSIASLTHGTQVTLEEGIGFPAVPEGGVTEVIVAVAGYSALTNTGRKLAQCMGDNEGITPTGQFLNDDEYKLTDEAKAILSEVEND